MNLLDRVKNIAIPTIYDTIATLSEKLTTPLRYRKMARSIRGLLENSSSKIYLGITNLLPVQLGIFMTAYPLITLTLKKISIIISSILKKIDDRVLTHGLLHELAHTATSIRSEHIIRKFCEYASYHNPNIANLKEHDRALSSIAKAIYSRNLFSREIKPPITELTLVDIHSLYSYIINQPEKIILLYTDYILLKNI